MRQQEEQNQQELIRLRNEQLEADLMNKSEELANSAMALIKKNELLVQLKEEVTNASKDGMKGHNSQKRLAELIEQNISNEQDWHVFETNFNKVHELFFKRLVQIYPELTHGDLKLAAYLRMNLSSKEIAQLLNITVRGVELKRYRLRKKMNLETEENLSDFMIKL